MSGRVTARGDGDRGSVTVLVATVVATIAVSLTVAIAELGGGLVDAARARAGADAAALASVTGGRAAAERVAGANGGTLVGWELTGGPGAGEVTVTVVVRVDGATARARATGSP